MITKRVEKERLLRFARNDTGERLLRRGVYTERSECAPRNDRREGLLRRGVYTERSECAPRNDTGERLLRLSDLRGFLAMTGVALIFMLLFIAVAPPGAQAAIPRYINYQGKLLDAEDNPVTGSVSVTIKIYDAETGGTALWTETQTVTVTRGIFSILLGNTTSLSSLNFNNPYWYSIEVASDGEMTPRQRLTAVAYAINADKLDGYDASQFLRADADTSLTGALTVSGNITGSANGDITLDPTGTGNIVMKIDSTSGDFKVTDGTTNWIKVSNAGAVTIAKDLTVSGTIYGTLASTGGNSTFTSIVVTGTSDLRGNISNSSGAVTIADVLTQTGSTNQVTFGGNVDANSGLDVTGALTVSGATTLSSALDMNSNIDLDYSGTSAALDVTQASTGPAAQFSGGRVVIGASEASNAYALSTGELYVLGDLEVDGTLYGNVSSSGSTSLGSTTLSSLTVTGTSDLQGNVSDSGGVFTIADNTGITPAELTSGGTDDYGLSISQTLNDTGAAGGSDVYRAIKLNVTETDKTGWDNVYLIDLQVGGTSEFNIADSGNITAGGTLNMSSNKITNLATPTASTDAATKNYADSLTLASAGGWTDGGTGVYLITSTDNVGIGTSSTGTYKLNVSGSTNTTSFYIGGTQVTADASELNKVDGYTGTAANLTTLTDASNADSLHTHTATGVTSGVVLTAPSSDQTIQPTAATVTPLILKGAASQSDNLLEFRDSSSNLLTYVDPSGRMFFDLGSGDYALAIAESLTAGAQNSAAKIYFGRNSTDDWEVMGYDPTLGTKGKFTFSAPLQVEASSPTGITFVEKDSQGVISKSQDFTYDPTADQFSFSGGVFAQQFKNLIKNSSFEAFSAFETFHGLDPNYATGTFDPTMGGTRNTTYGYEGGWENFEPDEWDWIAGDVFQNAPMSYKSGYNVAATSYTQDYTQGVSAVRIKDVMLGSGAENIGTGKDGELKQTISGLEPGKVYSVGIDMRVDPNTATATKGIVDIVNELNITGLTLNGNITPSTSTINITEATAGSIGRLPSNGFLWIEPGTADAEQISYTGKTASAVTGITRGINGTTARNHNSGVPISCAFRPLEATIPSASTFKTFKGQFITDEMATAVELHLIARSTDQAQAAGTVLFDSAQVVAGKSVPEYQSGTITDSGDQTIYGALRIGRASDEKGGILSVDKFVRTRGVEFFTDDPGFTGQKGGFAGFGGINPPMGPYNIGGTVGSLSLFTSGNYTGTTQFMNFYVEVTSAGTPNQFKWYYDDGTGLGYLAGNNAVAINVATTDITLGTTGVKVRFGATTGGISGDRWDFFATRIDSVGGYNSYGTTTAYTASTTRIFKDPDPWSPSYNKLIFEDAGNRISISDLISMVATPSTIDPAWQEWNGSTPNSGGMSVNTSGNYTGPDEKFYKVQVVSTGTAGVGGSSGTFKWRVDAGGTPGTWSSPVAMSFMDQAIGTEGVRVKFLENPMAGDPPARLSDEYITGGAIGDTWGFGVHPARGTTSFKTNPTATQTITATGASAANVTPIVIQMAAGQVADPFIIKDSSGASKLRIDKDGNITATSITGVSSTDIAGSTAAMFTIDSDNTTGTEPVGGAGFIIKGGSGNVNITYEATNNLLAITGQAGPTDTFAGLNIPAGTKYKIGGVNLSASDVGAAVSGHGHAGSDITSGTVSATYLPIAGAGTAGIIPTTGLTNAMVATTAAIDGTKILPNFGAQAIQTGVDGTDGQLKIFSEQGVTDYTLTLAPNDAMTANTTIKLPAAVATGESFLKMGVDGVIDYDTNAYLTAEVDGSTTNELPTAGSDIDVSGTEVSIEPQLDTVTTISRASSNLTLQTTTSGHIILTPAGNVGIGSTSPTQKLDVSGDIIANHIISRGGSPATIQFGTGASAKSLEFDMTSGEFSFTGGKMKQAFQNLVRGGSFESWNTPGWYSAWYGGAYTTTSYAKFGTKSLYLYDSSNTQTAFKAYYISNWDRLKGGNVTLSVWAKCDTGTATGSVGIGTNASSMDATVVNNIALTTAWQNFSFTYSVPLTATTLKVYLYGSEGTNGVPDPIKMSTYAVYYDGVTLVEGKLALEYGPSPVFDTGDQVIGGSLAIGADIDPYNTGYGMNYHRYPRIVFGEPDVNFGGFYDAYSYGGYYYNTYGGGAGEISFRPLNTSSGTFTFNRPIGMDSYEMSTSSWRTPALFIGRLYDYSGGSAVDKPDYAWTTSDAYIKGVVEADGGIYGDIMSFYGGVGKTSNLLTYSEDFTQGAWSRTPVGLQITTGELAPDGTSTACRLTSTVDAAITQTISATNSTVYTFSVYMASGTQNYAYIFLKSNIESDWWIWPNYQYVDLYNTTGWRRFSVTYTTPSTGVTSVTARVMFYGSASYNSIKVWGAQLRQAASQGIYIRTTSNSITNSNSLFHGDGSGLTNLPASSIASGTAAITGISGNTFTINEDLTGGSTDNLALAFNRGAQTDATIVWDETNDKFVINNPVNISSGGLSVAGTITAGTGSNIITTAAGLLNAAKLSGTVPAGSLPTDGYGSTYVNVTGDTMTGSLTLNFDAKTEVATIAKAVTTQAAENVTEYDIDISRQLTKPVSGLATWAGAVARIQNLANVAGVGSLTDNAVVMELNQASTGDTLVLKSAGTPVVTFAKTGDITLGEGADTITSALGDNLNIRLGDTAGGTNKLSIKNSAGAERFALFSDGTMKIDGGYTGVAGGGITLEPDGDIYFDGNIYQTGTTYTVDSVRFTGNYDVALISKFGVGATGIDTDYLQIDGDGYLSDLDDPVTINDALTQLGAGNQVTFQGNVDAANGLDVSGAALTTSGGLTVSGGSVSLPNNSITDAMVSNTLTASDLVAPGSVVSDAEVDNDITIASSNAGSFTGLTTSSNFTGSATLVDIDKSYVNNTAVTTSNTYTDHTITRAVTGNVGVGNTWTVDGAVVTINTADTQTSGTLTDNSTLLKLQTGANVGASGYFINAQNSAGTSKFSVTIAGAGTFADDLTVGGDLNVTGNQIISGTTLYDSAQTIRVNSTTALLVEKANVTTPGTGYDVLIVDTSGDNSVAGLVGINKSPASGVELDISGDVDISATLKVGTNDAFQVATSGAITSVGLNAGSGLITTSGNITTTGTGVMTSAGLLTASAGINVSGGNIAITDSSNIVLNTNKITLYGATGNAALAGSLTQLRSIGLTPDYDNAALNPDGADNFGTLTLKYASSHNYYEWTTSEPTTQDYDIVIRYRLPDGFSSFDATTPIKLWNKVSATPGSTAVNITMLDTAGSAVTLTGGSTLQNISWTESTITIGGTPTFTAGGYVTITIKMSADQGKLADVGELTLKGNW